MVLVGLTGLMGSGKSTVLTMFQKLGADIYNADVRAKKLMHTPDLSNNIIEIFGESAYAKGCLNRSYIAEIVFDNPVKLHALNSIVHPAVQKDFERFIRESIKKYVVYESALLFKSKANFKFDYIIVVTAPEEVRIQRIHNRDSINLDQIVKRLKQQQISEVDLKRADFVIENLDINAVNSEVLEIHKTILSNLELTKE